MNTTARTAAGITTLISTSLLLIVPLTAAAQPKTTVRQACPGSAIDPTCLVPPTATPPAAATTDVAVDDVAITTDVATAPIELSFVETAVADSLWLGTVGGDLTGLLATRLTEKCVAGPIWHVRSDWIIRAGDRSFVADLRGTLNTNTGQAEMHGTVVDGYLLGARVHEEGQLADTATQRFEGSIRLMQSRESTGSDETNTVEVPTPSIDLNWGDTAIAVIDEYLRAAECSS
jgi:hypothetical protein